MEAPNPELKLLIEKFPEYTARIIELYRNDPDFRDLCADYNLCSNLLLGYKREFSEKLYTIKEYQDIYDELEKELRDFLKAGKI
jgi:hypothetical protein